MRVAIATTDLLPDGGVHQAFGKAPYFIIHDSITGETSTIQNPVQTSGVSTGVEVARILIDQRVDKVVAGTFGERVRRVFSDAGVQMEAAGEKTLDEYIRSFSNLAGQTKLSPSSPTQARHLGSELARIERGSCYCSSCGYSTAEETEAPCFQRHCPRCQTPLERKF